LAVGSVQLDETPVNWPLLPVAAYPDQFVLVTVVCVANAAGPSCGLLAIRPTGPPGCTIAPAGPPGGLPAGQDAAAAGLAAASEPPQTTMRGTMTIAQLRRICAPYASVGTPRISTRSNG
jgi:hypothetical protein